MILFEDDEFFVNGKDVSGDDASCDIDGASLWRACR